MKFNALFPRGIFIVKKTPKGFGKQPGIFNSIDGLASLIQSQHSNTPHLPWHKYPTATRTTLERAGEWLATLNQDEAAWQIKHSDLTVPQRIALTHYCFVGKQKLNKKQAATVS